MNFEKRLALSLLALRVGVFIVMIMWTIDKFVNPGHAAAVYKKFYLIGGLSTELSYAIGGLQLLVVLGFLVGAFKRWTYGILLVIHAISTFSTWQMYLDPWGPRNLLFFAAFPMLSALIALFLLRDHDKMWSLH